MCPRRSAGRRVHQEEIHERHHVCRPSARLVSVYEIVIKGRVQGSLIWALEGFEPVPGRARETRFRGRVADQRDLHRVLKRISGCNLTLMSVAKVEDDPEDTADQ